MLPKGFAVALLILVCSTVQADITWTQSFEMPGPTPSYINQLETDTQGNLYAVVRQKKTEVWKWNSEGTKVYEAPVESQIVFGTHGDYFSYDYYGVSRYSRESGAQLWHQPLQRIIDLKVDQAGQPYLRFQRNGPGYWEKRAYATGNRIWTRGDGQIVMLDGPDLLFQDSQRVQLVSKEDGRTTKILDAPVAKAVLSGFPTSKGGGILAFATNKGSEIFGYRKGGIITRLSLFGSPIGIAKDGSVIVRTNEEVLRIDGDFRRVWARPASPGGRVWIDRNYVFLAGFFEVNRLRIDDGGAANPISTASINATGCVEHNGRVVVADSNMAIASLKYFEATSGTFLHEWTSTSEGRPITDVAAAAAMPNGDLIAVTHYMRDLSVARISTAGDLIWATTIPDMGAIWGSNADGVPKSWISIDPDASSISIYTQGNFGRQGAELDPATGAVKARFAGYQIVSGNFAYRTTLRGNQAFTSKFDRTTGKEIWRIPRSGLLHVDGRGHLYVGASKNRISDGQLVWSLPNQLLTIAIRDGRVFFLEYAKGVGAADEETGAILWQNYIGSTSGYGNKSAEISFDDGMVLFRPGGDDAAYAFSLIDGARILHGPYNWNSGAAGVKLSDGYYRPGARVADYTCQLTKASGFFGDDPVEVGTISFIPRLFVACPSGGFYILGDGSAGFTVGRWQ